MDLVRTDAVMKDNLALVSQQKNAFFHIRRYYKLIDLKLICINRVNNRQALPSAIAGFKQAAVVYTSKSVFLDTFER